MKIKVSEATNIQLNWMVAKAQGLDVTMYDTVFRACRWRSCFSLQYTS